MPDSLTHIYPSRYEGTYAYSTLFNNYQYRRVSVLIHQTTCIYSRTDLLFDTMHLLCDMHIMCIDFRQLAHVLHMMITYDVSIIAA